MWNFFFRLFILIALALILLILISVAWLFTAKGSKLRRFLRKIFFPLSTEKYKFLENKSWHRLIKTIFFIFIPVCLIITVAITYNRSFNNCYIGLTNAANPYAAQQTAIEDKQSRKEISKSTCSNEANDGRLFIILESMEITLIMFYLLQIIYYKWVIYIIYGKEKR